MNVITSEYIRTKIIPALYGYIILFGILIFVWTLFQCPDLYEKLNNKWDPQNIDELIIVTSAGGYISVGTAPVVDDRQHLVTSYSSIPIDAGFQTEEGNNLFTYQNMMPGESLLLDSKFPCRITFYAS